MNSDYRPDAPFIKVLHGTYGKEVVDWYTRIPFYHMYHDTFKATGEFLNKEDPYFDPIKYLPIGTWINFSVDPAIMNFLYGEVSDKQLKVLSNIVFKVELTDDNRDLEVSILRTGFSKVKNKDYLLSEMVTGLLRSHVSKGEVGFKKFNLSMVEIEGNAWKLRGIPKAVSKELAKLQTYRIDSFNAISDYVAPLLEKVDDISDIDLKKLAIDLQLPEATIEPAFNEIYETPKLLIRRIMLFITLLAYAEYKKLSRVSVQRPTTKKDGKAKLSKPWTRKDLPSIIYLDALPRDPKPHQGGTHKSPIPYQVQPFNRVLRHEKYGRNRGKIIRVKGHTRGGDIMSSEYRGQIYTVSPEWEYLKS